MQSRSTQLQHLTVRPGVNNSTQIRKLFASSKSEGSWGETHRATLSLEYFIYLHTLDTYLGYFLAKLWTFQMRSNRLFQLRMLTMCISANHKPFFCCDNAVLMVWLGLGTKSTWFWWGRYGVLASLILSPQISKLTIKDSTVSYCFTVCCLYAADPATLLASSTVLGTLFSSENSLKIRVMTSLTLIHEVWCLVVYLSCVWVIYMCFFFFFFYTL